MPESQNRPLPDAASRRLITLFLLPAAMMNLIDTTIANVALPHMQGSTSSSREEITWVLTSYIVSGAIFTPLTGWLSRRFGRKRLLVGSIAGFTLVSMLCGLANSLDELVLARVLQGAVGSSLAPLAQSTMIDINPPERHGKAMALFGLAAILGPLIGPVAGGWLTDALSWRWVFFINLPIGLVASIGLLVAMPSSPPDPRARLDLFGFTLLSLGVGSLQLLLDRGQTLDWLSSPEIVLEMTVCALALITFAIHSLTARDPFLSPGLFADRNYILSVAVFFTVGWLVFSSMAQMPPMLGNLFGYSTFDVGMVMGPRGASSILAMLLMGRLIGRVDSRLLIAMGMALMGVASIQLSELDLQADRAPLIITGLIQGFGASCVFPPLATMSFATLPPRLRDEGAALSAMLRNLGASAGIAVIETMTYRNTTRVHARLAEGLRPDNPLVAMHLPDMDWGATGRIAALEHSLSRQAAMVGYIDAFWILGVTAFAALPFIYLLRQPKRAPSGTAMPAEIIIEH